MVGVLFAPTAGSSSSSSSLPLTFSSFYSPPRLEPCPFCQFCTDDDCELILHIEIVHPEDGTFILDNVAVNDSEEYVYVPCPEPGCEELILLLELQTHMDFHFAENMGMEQSIIQQQPVRREHRRRENGERSERRGEKGERIRKERKDGEDGKHRHHHHDRNHHHKPRERGSTRGGKDPGVASFIGPSVRSRSPVRSGLNWFEKVVLVIAPHHTLGIPLEQRHEERRRSESKRRERSNSLRRSDSKRPESNVLRKSDNQVRRSESRRRSSSAPLELTAPPAKLKRSSSSSSKADSRKPIGTIKKLGKSDLGPYAHEAQMPDWLRTQLEKGGKTITVQKIDPLTGRLVNEVQIANETPDLIPTIALLCERDPEVVKVYLCHAKVKHIGKQIPREGGFCGYRNIQMMISYIQAALPRGSHPFEGRIPTILKLQEMIEDGWARGINSSARLETGGIMGTRKYIGTSEAQTLLTAIGLRSRPRAFVKSSEGTFQTQNSLLSYIEEYFESGILHADDSRTSQKVMGTNKPPIYLQHSGHSMTIVGLEKWRDGSRSLLVFDPFFSPSEVMRNLASARRLGGKVRPEVLLKVYRRKMNYLAKYKEFEAIVLEP